MADYSQIPIHFNKVFEYVEPPESDMLMAHLSWVCCVLAIPSRESMFAYSLMNQYATRLNLSEKQIEAAKDLVKRVYEAYSKQAEK